MKLHALLLAAAVLVAFVAAHEHHGEAPICAGGGGRVLAEFRPGEVTLDGHPADWEAVEASEFPLLPALDPDDDKAYTGGKVTVKAVHDGVNVFFMLQVDGDYAYTKGENKKCPSVALMFQVGEKATYQDMGGCKDLPDSCTSKSCRDHEVDILHFSLGNAIPGRLYGGNHIDNAAGNGGDRFGHLVDTYAWNPHCRYLDGIGPKENNSNAQNDWHGAWWHNSLTFHSGFVDDDSPYGKQDDKGTYYFEFSRPLRTMDQFQQFGGHHYKGLLDKTTVSITGQGDTSHQHAFQKDYYFFLPRNRTVFDINIEAFQQKPWRQHGVDLNDYFNFGLDEEGWRKYCFGIKQFTQEGRSLAEKSSGMDQESHHNLESCKSMQKSATYSGVEGSNDLAKPKGRAIHVEGGLFERLPSADLWRPRQRDSDVVIQVNMTLSPPNHSSSDDNSTVNDKCMTTERILVNSPGVKCLKDTSLVVDRVVDKGVLSGSSSECTGSKLDIRDSACTRGHSSCHDYSDMLSEESTEDCYFKRANRHSNSKALRSDTKFKDAHVRSVLCRHSSKSDKECSKGDSHGYTPSSDDDKYHKKIKSLRAHEPDFMSRGVYVNRQNGHCLIKPRHDEQKRKGSARVRHDRHDVFNKEEKIADSYPSSYAREYEGKISDSTFLSNDRRNAVRNKVYEKRDYSPVERATLRNDVHLFGRNSNHQRSRSWHEFSDDEDVVQNFSSAKGWQQRHDYGYGYKSMLKAEFSDDFDGRVYRESYYQETRRVRHGHSEDDEVFHYNDYRSRERRSPEVRGEYRNRRSAESSYEHSGHPYHLVLSPRANDYPKSSERDWPSPALTSLNSGNRCTGNERIRHAKIMRYDHDGYIQNNKQYSPPFHVGNIQRSALYTAAGVETGYSFLPVKRKLHADLGSVDHKDLVGLALPKGRRLTHHQPLISDRKLYAAEVHNSPNEFVRETIFGFGDMRNNKTILNIERRHGRLNFQLKDADSIHLNDRKRKFKRQGNEIKREVESDHEGCLPGDEDLHSSKQKDVHQKTQKLNGSYQDSAFHQELKKKTFPKRQNTNEDEIEEGELIEEDHQDTVPASKLNKPRKAVLRSVIEASSAGMSKVVSDQGAARECGNEQILAAMEKMQKRRERFKEPVVAQKEQDIGKTEQLAVACSAEDTKNQRPARKRRWGGNG